MARPLNVQSMTAVASIVGVLALPQMLDLFRLVPTWEARGFAGAASRVARDPVTGQIVTPEYAGRVMTIDEMITAARLEAAGLFTIHNVDGSETINHQGRFADDTIVRVGRDGKRVFLCVSGRAATAQALKPAAAVSPSAEDR